jgi:hypothetical protein
MGILQTAHAARFGNKAVYIGQQGLVELLALPFHEAIIPHQGSREKGACENTLLI